MGASSNCDRGLDSFSFPLRRKMLSHNKGEQENEVAVVACTFRFPYHLLMKITEERIIFFTFSQGRALAGSSTGTGTGGQA
jgi:hypothetical protein